MKANRKRNSAWDWLITTGRWWSRIWKKQLSGFSWQQKTGHPNAQYNLGVLHVQGQGVDKDFRKAAKWFRAAADQGETTSQYNMGIFHLNGLGVPADPAESLRYFSLAAAQGDTRSQFQLGVAIARGEGIAQNFPEAYLWINLAAKKGHQEAMSALNELLGLMTPEDLFAGRLLNAERGDADDQFEVAMAHRGGHGVDSSQEKSIQWLKASAEQDQPEAQTQTPAKLTLQAREWTRTLHWLRIGIRKPLNRGHRQAQFYLGNMYEIGKGVEQNLSVAMDWFRKAAEAGILEAQFKMGSACAIRKGSRSRHEGSSSLV